MKTFMTPTDYKVDTPNRCYAFEGITSYIKFGVLARLFDGSNMFNIK